MRILTAQLPEYPVVMAMRDVGSSLGPQLMVKLGDVIRFTHRILLQLLQELTLKPTSPVRTKPAASEPQKVARRSCANLYS